MQAPDRSILLKCLSGEASPEEAALLDTWLNASPENRREFDALWKIWQMTATAPGYSIPETAKDWQALHTRIQAPLMTPSPGSGNTHIHPEKTTVFRLARPGIWKALSVFLAGGILTGIILVKTKKAPAKKLPDQQLIVRHSGGMTLKDSLSGGAIVTLDEQSVLAYPAKPDTTYLLKGKAYIQASAKPFTIRVGDLVAGTNGGNFLLSGDSATGAVDIQVSKGTVKVMGPAGAVTIQEGHSLIYDASTHRFTEKNSTDTNSVAFATGVFSFTNAPLKDLTSVLAKAYRIDIRLDNPAVGNCRMTVQFDNLPIKNILDIIAATLNVSYSTQGKTISIRGKGCE